MSPLREKMTGTFFGSVSGWPRGTTPLRLFLLLLFVVFTLDALETWLTPLYFPCIEALPRIIHDPLFTTLFIAPFLWLLVVRPLQRGAMNEKIRYEAVKSQVVDAVVTIDMNGQIITFNPAAERIFGYSPDEISGRNAAGLFCDGMLSAENLELVTLTNEQSPPLIHQVTCHTKDGQPLKLEISVSRMLLAGSAQFLVIMRDITNRLLLERESREMESRLIQANKMTSLGLMVSGVAHEVNNPNNYILSNAQLLERSCSDIIKILREYHTEYGDFQIGGLSFTEMEQHFPEMITGIIGGTQRINSIINNLKTFARQGVGEQSQPIEVNQAIISAVSIVSSQIMLHTTRFTVDLADSLPLINGNSQKIGQVAINLLMNACQALPDTASAVTLKTRYDEKAAEVVISVADEGEGVPPEVCERLFEPFFSTRRTSGGTGLGLAIVHSIIKEHNGSISFETRPGRGTIFYVRLPAVVTDKLSYLEGQ